MVAIIGFTRFLDCVNYEHEYFSCEFEVILFELELYCCEREQISYGLAEENPASQRKSPFRKISKRGFYSINMFNLITTIFN